MPEAPISLGRAFFDRARARLTLDVPPALHDLSVSDFMRGDLDRDPVLWEKAGVAATRPAAVLIAVVDHAEPSVILTTRTSDLPSHAGQIAFPGGKMDKVDASPLAAAMREAEEEIGLDAHLIEPIGYLDLYLTFSGFRILPVLARVIPNYELRINASEVADAFEVPLDFLMNPAHHHRHAIEIGGVKREWFSMPYMDGGIDRFIWGATAAMLRNFYRLLAA